MNVREMSIILYTPRIPKNYSLFMLKEADLVAYNIAQLPLYNLRERSPDLLSLILAKDPGISLSN